jgi:ribosomal protein S27AE
VSIKLMERVAIGLLYVFASPIYVVQWLLRASKALTRMSKLRSGVVTCPHCGFANHVDALMTCRRCGTTEFGSRLYCTTCKQVLKAFACDRCTATIKVL